MNPRGPKHDSSFHPTGMESMEHLWNTDILFVGGCVVIMSVLEMVGRQGKPRQGRSFKGSLHIRVFATNPKSRASGEKEPYVRLFDAQIKAPSL